MTIRSEVERVGLALLSINSVTGALVGAAAPVTYLFVGMATEIIIGRPSPDQLAGTVVLALPFFGGLGAVVGAVLGWVGRQLLRRTAVARPTERTTVASALALVVLFAASSGVLAARRYEARHRPHVMHTTSAVTRLAGFGELTPAIAATRLLSARQSATSGQLGPWEIRLDKKTLLVSHAMQGGNQVSLSGLDYVTDVYGVTATGAQSEEWLALLVRLRATGRRELLLIYDSTGALVHKELLARTRSGPADVLWSAGPAAAEQSFLVDVGKPLRSVIND